MYVKLLALCGAVLLASAPVQDQALYQSRLHRTQLLQSNLSIRDREIVQVRVDFEPGASSIRHRHPGEEIAFVLQGVIEYQLGAQVPVIVRTGQSLFIPDGIAHTARNIGQGTASELATYVVRRNAILVEPTQ